MKGDSVYRKGLKFSRDIVEIGYVICPPNEIMPRKDYIAYCYRTNTISILTETFGYINNVIIEKSKIQEIVFPEESMNEDENVPYGSAVLILNETINNRAFVIGVYQVNHNIAFSKENLFSIQRISPNNEVSIIGDGDSGEVIIKTKSKNSGQGGLTISIINDNKSAKFNLDIQGDINIRCENNININALNQIILKVLNQATEKETKLSFKDQEIKINEGTDVAVLGNKLVAELNKTNTYLQSLEKALELALVPSDTLAPGTSENFISTMSLQTLGDYTQVLSQIFKIE